MTTYHHLKYVDTPFRLPTAKEAMAQLKNSDLKAGDVINLKDGTLYAYVVDRLSDFGQPFSEAACEQIVSEDPKLVQLKRNPCQPYGEFERHVYSQRKVMTTDGQCVKQVLVKAFGKATWINICQDRDQITLREDYEAQRDH